MTTPGHLSNESKKIWHEYADKVVKSPGRKAMLLVGLEALDKASEAQQIIEKEGMITKTGKSGVPHAHPAIRIQKDSWSLALKTFKTLNLHLDPICDELF